MRLASHRLPIAEPRCYLLELVVPRFFFFFLPSRSVATTVPGFHGVVGVRGTAVPPIFFLFFLFRIATAVLRFRLGSFRVATSDVFWFHVATAVLRFRRGSFHVAPAVLRFLGFFLVHVRCFFVSRRHRGAEVPPRFISRRHRGAEVLRMFFLFHVATAVLRFRLGSFHVAPAVPRFFGCFLVSRRHRGAAVPPRFVSRRPRGAEVLRIFFFVSRRHRGAAVPPRFVSRRPRGVEILRIFLSSRPMFFCFAFGATAVLRFRRGSFHVAPAVPRFFGFFFCFTSPPRC